MSTFDAQPTNAQGALTLGQSILHFARVWRTPDDFRDGGRLQAIAAFRRAQDLFALGDNASGSAEALVGEAQALLELTSGSHAENVERAFRAATAALAVVDRGGHARQWASAKAVLAQALGERSYGPRAANIDGAIANLAEAEAAFGSVRAAEDQARAQILLGRLYRLRSARTGAADLELSIRALRSAIAGLGSGAHQIDRLTARRELAASLSVRTSGDRLENLTSALGEADGALAAFPDRMRTSNDRELNDLVASLRSQSLRIKAFAFSDEYHGEISSAASISPSAMNALREGPNPDLSQPTLAALDLYSARSSLCRVVRDCTIAGMYSSGAVALYDQLRTIGISERDQNRLLTIVGDLYLDWARSADSAQQTWVRLESGRTQLLASSLGLDRLIERLSTEEQAQLQALRSAYRVAMARAEQSDESSARQAGEEAELARQRLFQFVNTRAAGNRFDPAVAATRALREREVVIAPIIAPYRSTLLDFSRRRMGARPTARPR